MRRLARIGLAALGLAVAAPVAVWAGQPVTASTGAKKHKHPRNLFGKEKLCVECQRAKLKAQGIDMPAPPPLPQGVVMEGGVCTTCQPGAPGMAVVNGDTAPGFAVVGDPMMPGEGPAPIGVVQARPGGPMMPGAGLMDRSVMPTSIPRAPEPIAPAESNRPHVISHVLGLSAIGRDRRADAHRRAGQKHASIRYGAEEPRVTELPASKVYGRTWWGGDPR